MVHALAWLGRRGQYFLIAGLICGLLLPSAAEAIRPWIGTLIGLLLVVTGIRVGARAALGNLDDFWVTLSRIGLLQVALPLAALGLFRFFGFLNHPLALAVILMLSAPSVTGAPNFAIMIGRDPAPGMRLLVLGTALFPLTALPVFFLVEQIGGGFDAVFLSLKLLAVVIGAVGVGFVIRRTIPSLGDPPAREALDGVAALLLVLAVVGLMSAIGPMLRNEPQSLFLWILVAIVINFGLVLATLYIDHKTNAEMPVATAIYAGNRNIALFLTVLPEWVAAPLMIFIGCYQIPMYLTPFLLTRLKLARPRPQ